MPKEKKRKERRIPRFPQPFSKPLHCVFLLNINILSLSLSLTRSKSSCGSDHSKSHSGPVSSGSVNRLIALYGGEPRGGGGEYRTSMARKVNQDCLMFSCPLFHISVFHSDSLPLSLSLSLTRTGHLPLFCFPLRTARRLR